MRFNLLWLHYRDHFTEPSRILIDEMSTELSISFLSFPSLFINALGLNEWTIFFREYFLARNNILGVFTFCDSRCVHSYSSESSFFFPRSAWSDWTQSLLSFLEWDGEEEEEVSTWNRGRERVRQSVVHVYVLSSYSMLYIYSDLLLYVLVGLDAERVHLNRSPVCRPRARFTGAQTWWV